MPTVEIPNLGEIEFPDSMSQDEIVAAIKKLPKAGTLARPSSMSALPSSGALPTTPMPEEQEPGMMDLNRQVIPRETGKEYLPTAMGIAGAMAGGSGLLLPTALSAVGASGGKAIQQGFEGETDLYDVTKTGVKTGLGTLGGGLAFKAIGALAQKIFSPSKLTPAAQKAAEFAKKEGLPAPASSMAPGSRAAQVQEAAGKLLPGKIKTIKDATKINTFINQTVGKMTRKAKPIDEIAVKGQQFFKNIFDEAKTGGEAGFEKFVSNVGQKTEIPIRNFLMTADDAINQMKSAGIGGTLMTKLRTIQKSGVSRLSLEMVEGIRKDIGKIARRTNSVKTLGDDLKEAILRDYDEVGAQLGISARDMAEEAISKFASFARLKKEFPQLERFSKQFGEKGGTYGSKQWFGELFTEGNAKALNEIRKQSPELYRELSDTWLAQIMDRHTTAVSGMFGKVLDGQKFRRFFEQNKNTFTKILGKERTKILDNFSNYANNVDDALRVSKMKGEEEFARLAGEGAGVIFAPHIMIPGEAASYALAKGLSNPNSQLFKIFTEGAGPTFKKSVRLPLMIGGQEAVRRGSDQR